MKLLKQFIQQETVLTAAAVLAVVSAFFVPPDAQYLGYIDLRTLAILFSLMTVMAGLRRQGFFDGLGRALLSRTHSTFQLTLVLVGLCFFGSMFITNDVSLLTFVPFTFVVLSRLGADVRRSLLIPVVCMQTIAANLGSMLTPIGNPQNLYLYGKSGMSIGGFVLLMLPYTLVSLLLLLAWAALVCRKASAALSVWHTPGHTEGGVVLLCGDYLFVGDTVFQGSIGRTDLEGGSMQKMDASLRKLAGLPIPKETQLLPGHGDFSTLGEELANNFYIRSALRGGNADF